MYVVSEALGWGLVPETVLRDGPLGPGSVQRFVAADFAEHYFTLLERPEHHDALRAICLFDLLVNNGDRKAGTACSAPTAGCGPSTTACACTTSPSCAP